MDNKIINITGIHNKPIKKEKEIKKRVQSEKWEFPDDYYEHTKQMNLIIDISNGNLTDYVSKIMVNEISKKISSYKQQDKLKKKLDISKFLTLRSVIDKMIDCELKCRYCKNLMDVLYDISREMKQWSVDRIDNDLGHNIDNYHLACLECNLKRRRRTDEKFLFTKQLVIIKQDN